jgi:hypothetical protein
MKFSLAIFIICVLLHNTESHTFNKQSLEDNLQMIKDSFSLWKTQLKYREDQYNLVGQQMKLKKSDYDHNVKEILNQGRKLHEEMDEYVKNLELEINNSTATISSNNQKVGRIRDSRYNSGEYHVYKLIRSITNHRLVNTTINDIFDRIANKLKRSSLNKISFLERRKRRKTRTKQRGLPPRIVTSYRMDTSVYDVVEDKAAELTRACITSFYQTMETNFCYRENFKWKDNIFGTICPKKYDSIGTSCLEQCPENYELHAGLCWEKCGTNLFFDETVNCQGFCGKFSCDNILFLKMKKVKVPQFLTLKSEFVKCPERGKKFGLQCFPDCASIGMVECGLEGCASSYKQCNKVKIPQRAKNIYAITNFLGYLFSFETDKILGSIDNEGFTEALNDLQIFKTYVGSRTIDANHMLKTISLNSKVSKEFADEVGKNAYLRFSNTHRKERSRYGAICQKVAHKLLKLYSQPEKNDLDFMKSSTIIPNVSSCELKSNTDSKCVNEIYEFASQLSPYEIPALVSEFLYPVCTFY